MFDFVNDVLTRVAPPLGTAALGYAGPYLRTRYRYRRTTKLWKPVATDRALAVLGSHELPDVEPGSLVGFGDVRALDDLRAFFKDARLPMFDLSYDKAVTGQQRERNLVLIGGPKPNRLVDAVLTTCKVQLVFDEPSPYVFALRDRTNDASFIPLRSNGKVTTDYGIVVSAPNPFTTAKQCRVIIFAGCYGYGTWAAARLATFRDSALLREPLVSSANPFECVIQTNVVRGEPTPATFAIPPRVL
jgi:hypothetical protein